MLYEAFIYIHLRREAHVERTTQLPLIFMGWIGQVTLIFVAKKRATMGQQIYLDNVGHINLYIYILYYIYI